MAMASHYPASPEPDSRPAANDLAAGFAAVAFGREASRASRPSTLLAICGAIQRGSYREIMMVGLIGPLIALAMVITLGKLFGAF
jgi:hypothetical protein